MKIETEKLVLNDVNEHLKALMNVPSYKFGAFTFDCDKRVLIHGGSSVKLTAKESYLLVMLAANLNNFLDRKFLLHTIWREDNFRNSRCMDVYVYKLRKVLEKDPNVNIINLHGKGHKMIVSK